MHFLLLLASKGGAFVLHSARPARGFAFLCRASFSSHPPSHYIHPAFRFSLPLPGPACVSHGCVCVLPRTYVQVPRTAQPNRAKRSLLRASQGPDHACARSTSPLCLAPLSLPSNLVQGVATQHSFHANPLLRTNTCLPRFPLETLASSHCRNKHQ